MDSQGSWRLLIVLMVLPLISALSNLVAPLEKPSPKPISRFTNSTTPSSTSHTFTTKTTSTSTVLSVHIETSPPEPSDTIGLTNDAPTPSSNDTDDVPDENYHTDYPGPVHSKEWTYYLSKYNPTWWRTNLDIITSTVCLCSSPETNSTASYVEYDYRSHSHPDQKSYLMNHVCGPHNTTDTSNNPKNKNDENNPCYPSALGLRSPTPEATFCIFDPSDGQNFCVNWQTKGKRWMTWHGHLRNFDRKGVHEWVWRAEEVEEACERECGGNGLGMGWDREGKGEGGDGDGDGGGGWKVSWFPAKPIPWG